MNRIGRLGKAFLYTLVGILLAWTVFTAVSRLVKPTEYPMLFGYSEAGIVSGSMEPTLSTGDHVVFHKQESYAVNDIVVYYDEAEGIFVAHRIVGTSNGDFIVQGDYNPECDPVPVKVENIQGKVIYAIPNLQAFLYIALGSVITVLMQNIIKLVGLLKEGKQGGNQRNEK